MLGYYVIGRWAFSLHSLFFFMNLSVFFFLFWFLKKRLNKLFLEPLFPLGMHSCFHVYPYSCTCMYRHMYHWESLLGNLWIIWSEWRDLDYVVIQHLERILKLHLFRISIWNQYDTVQSCMEYLNKTWKLIFKCRKLCLAIFTDEGVWGRGYGMWLSNLELESHLFQGHLNSFKSNFF